jgi:hypothetical protein
MSHFGALLAIGKLRRMGFGDCLLKLIADG